MTNVTLLGDIGGTNSRFALVNKGRTDYRSERHYENERFPTFQDAIEAYVVEVGERPNAGVVAIAGPVAGEMVGPTNRQSWLFNPPSLAAALRFVRLDVINDFEAVAHALPHLADSDTATIGEVQAYSAGGNMAVLGPGTGLGVGALVRGGSRWVAVPSEGGHAEIGAPDGEWAKAHELIRKKIGRVSGEHVLSGPGLQRIDAALNTLAGHPQKRSAADIGTSAVAGTDAIAVEAAHLFFDYLARFSGDVALMFAAKGGVFLYGGVVQKLSALMDKQAFRRAFEAKAPLEKFLAQIPTRLIIHPTPGLIGCAAVAAHW
ncbi:glucokinase [Labrys miyagiensis]